eukprot:gene27587-33320_t
METLENYKRMQAEHAHLKGDGVDTAEERSALFAFLMKLSEKRREQLSLALGVTPGDLSETAQLFVKAVHSVANIVDPRVEPFCCRISPCKQFVEPFVTKVAIIQKLMEALQAAQVDFGEFPCNKKYVNMIVKSYYRDMLGLGLVDNVSEDETKYSDKEKRELKRLIRSRSVDDFLFGQKLIRLLKVGSADSRIEPDVSYGFFKDNLPFFRCWYGGPYSLANRVITYMQDCGVAYAALHKAILEFDQLWPLYIRDMISTAIVVNEKDYNRAVSGAIRDEKLKELGERIRAYSNASQTSSPDRARGRSDSNASSVAGDTPGDRSSRRTPLPAIPQGVVLAAGPPASPPASPPATSASPTATPAVTSPSPAAAATEAQQEQDDHDDHEDHDDQDEGHDGACPADVREKRLSLKAYTALTTEEDEEEPEEEETKECAVLVSDEASELAVA